MYATEKQFSTAFCNKLKKNYCKVTKIESHGTGNGIPDLYIASSTFNTFVELKNDNKLSILDSKIKVKWRPGQIAWMYEDFLIQRIINRSCLTVIACCDGWFIIPMTKRFNNDIIENANDFGVSYSMLKGDGSVNSTRRLLRLMSRYYCGNFDDITTFRDAVNLMIEEIWTGFIRNDIDYDPEVLWNACNSKKNVDDIFDVEVFERAKISIFCEIEAIWWRYCISNMENE